MTSEESSPQICLFVSGKPFLKITYEVVDALNDSIAKRSLIKESSKAIIVPLEKLQFNADTLSIPLSLCSSILTATYNADITVQKDEKSNLYLEFENLKVSIFDASPKVLFAIAIIDYVYVTCPTELSIETLSPRLWFVYPESYLNMAAAELFRVLCEEFPNLRLGLITESPFVISSIPEENILLKGIYHFPYIKYLTDKTYALLPDKTLNSPFFTNYRNLPSLGRISPRGSFRAEKMLKRMSKALEEGYFKMAKRIAKAKLFSYLAENDPEAAVLKAQFEENYPECAETSIKNLTEKGECPCCFENSFINIFEKNVKLYDDGCYSVMDTPQKDYYLCENCKAKISIDDISDFLA